MGFMSAPVILNWLHESLSFERSRLKQELEDIYIESSMAGTFKDPEAFKTFLWKYLGFYLHYYPEFIWVALGSDLECLGYVLGAPRSDHEELLKIQPHLKLFENCFKRFPAHLHLNCHKSYRGVGIGGELVRTFENDIKTISSGLHIITTTDARNRSFYLRHGLSNEFKMFYKNTPLVLMAKDL